MKLFQVSLIVLTLVINLLIAGSSKAEAAPSLVSNPHYFEVGQKVVWLYKVRSDSTNVKKIPAEVVKLGDKQVQIKIRTNKNGFINRWVNKNRLENISNI